MTYDTINNNMRVLINMLLCLANYKSPQLAHSLTIRFAFIYRHHQSCLIDFKCYLFSPKIIDNGNFWHFPESALSDVPQRFQYPL